LQRYLEFSAKGEAEILAAVDSLILSSEPIIVWGAGTLARRLLANTRFAGVNIVAFVDSDLHLQGTALAGKPILNPAQISHRKETILVCSITFSAEIAAAIRSQYGLSNRIYSLLGDVLREN
jgi:FlaA1/EpsC-like NDP-sugar epimerase